MTAKSTWNESVLLSAAGGSQGPHRSNPLRFQNPSNRGSPDTMADVPQCAEDPRVAPRGTLLGHPHHQALDLREHASRARRWLRVRPFPRDELPAPAQERIWRDDRGDLTQPPTTQAIRTHGKPAPVVIGQRQASAPQLPTQDTVLFNEMAEYVSVLAVQPPGEDGEQQLKRRGVHHAGNLYHGPGFHAPSCPSIQPRDITGQGMLTNFGIRHAQPRTSRKPASNRNCAPRGASLR